jgi:hypothetical protein
MPADTFSEMILGFSVILGILALYVVTLFFRIRKARSKGKEEGNQSPPVN